MNTFQSFISGRLEADYLDIHSIGIDTLKGYISDYLFLELYENEEVDEKEDLSVEGICNRLSLYEDDEKDFYFQLIIEIINIINVSKNCKPITVQLGDEASFENLGLHFSYHIGQNEPMKNNFLLLYNSLEEEKEINVSK